MSRRTRGAGERYAATEAEVWWDGELLGSHLGGWTPFRFDVTELVRRAPPGRPLAPIGAKVTIRADRGWQNSGISGNSARSFYYPKQSKKCADCHMPLVASKDAGNINGFVHSHRFPAANTASHRK